MTWTGFFLGLLILALYFAWLFRDAFRNNQNTSATNSLPSQQSGSSNSADEYLLACKLYRELCEKMYENPSHPFKAAEGKVYKYYESPSEEIREVLGEHSPKMYCLINARNEMVANGYIPSNAVYSQNKEQYDAEYNGYHTYSSSDIDKEPNTMLLEWLRIYDKY